MTPREKALLVAAAIVAKNASEVVILDVREISGFTDFFVIAGGTSARQTRAIANAGVEAVSKSGERPLSIEGERIGRWILVDFSDVVLHVLQHEARSYYDLERLWREAQAIELPELAGSVG